MRSLEKWPSMIKGKAGNLWRLYKIRTSSLGSTTTPPRVSWLILRRWVVGGRVRRAYPTRQRWRARPAASIRIFPGNLWELPPVLVLILSKSNSSCRTRLKYKSKARGSHWNAITIKHAWPSLSQAERFSIQSNRSYSRILWHPPSPSSLKRQSVSGLSRGWSTRTTKYGKLGQISMRTSSSAVSIWKPMTRHMLQINLRRRGRFSNVT